MKPRSDACLHFSATRGDIEASFDKGCSYEIKLIPLMEYKKLIIMLDDTTQRDLAISLEAVNKYKDNHLATVSHDLRAPINGSLAFIESSLEHRSIPQFVKDQLLTPAQNSCRFLLHLVNDILNFSQINTQKLRLSFEALSIADTIKNCYQLIEVQAKQKKLILSLDLDSRLPTRFTTDHTRVSQIIINLLTNAIKFTSKGSVSLTATYVSGSIIKIKITDTGIGMKEEDIKKLFQEFTRIEYEQKELNTRGVGLGLVIANRLAQRLGPRDLQGGINVSSVYNKGSIFSFMLEEKNLSTIELKDVLSPRRPQTRDLKSRASFDILPLDNEEDEIFESTDEHSITRLKMSSRRPYINTVHENSTRLIKRLGTSTELEINLKGLRRLLEFSLLMMIL